MMDIGNYRDENKKSGNESGGGNVIRYEAYSMIESQWVDENSISHEFEGREGVIVLKDGITEIGESAFYICYELKSINIPDGIMTIGVGAFASSGLESVHIPDSVKEICEGAFNCCMDLSSVYIPASVTKIGIDVFVGCDMLASMVVDRSNPIYDSRENCNAIIETATNKLLYGCANTIIPS